MKMEWLGVQVKIIVIFLWHIIRMRLAYYNVFVYVYCYIQSLMLHKLVKIWRLKIYNKLEFD